MLKLLRKGDEYTTKEIAYKIGRSRSSCYAVCRLLEKKTLLKSKKRVGGRIFWDPVTEQIMTKDNHDEIMEAREEALEEEGEIEPIVQFPYYVKWWLFNQNWKMV